MIFETLFGGLLGGALRLAPEVMKFFDRKNERAHELARSQQEMELAKLQTASQAAALAAQNQIVLDSGGLQALIAAQQGQAQKTGIKWVDAINALVRPTITYWTFALYSATKIAAMLSLSDAGVSMVDVLKLSWAAEDQAMLAGIVNFWFLDRVIRKNAGQ